MSDDQPATVKTKKKFYKRPVVWIVAIFLIFTISIANGDGKTNKNLATSNPTPEVATGSEGVRNEATPTPTASVKSAQITPAPVTPPAPTQTISQKNALSKAKDYLSYTAFSHDGLVHQLEFEQFSTADATYGADNVGANWNEQAAKKAKDYMSYSSFSRGSLIDQLQFEKFTPEQAAYGASSVGL